MIYGGVPRVSSSLRFTIKYHVDSTINFKMLSKVVSIASDLVTGAYEPRIKSDIIMQCHASSLERRNTTPKYWRS